MGATVLEYREFKTVAEYEKVFLNADYWRSYVDAALQQIGLSAATKVESPRQGSNVVFLVDDKFCVKIFTNVLNGPQQRGIEKLALEILDNHPQLLVPRLIGTGELFPNHPWPWEFVITEKLHGTALDHLWADLNDHQRNAVAEDIGNYFRALHRIPIPTALRELITQRMGSESFLNKWVREGGSRCIRLGVPPHLAKQVPDFVAKWLPPPTPERILNGDLTGEHLFGITTNEKWQTTAIIDYGDLKLGNPMYDFVAAHFGIFRADTALLKSALRTYGGDVLEPNAMMALSLIHEWDVLRESFAERTDLADATSLEQVADSLWSI